MNQGVYNHPNASYTCRFISYTPRYFSKLMYMLDLTGKTLLKFLELVSVQKLSHFFLFYFFQGFINSTI